MMTLEVSIAKQTLSILADERQVKEYRISTAKNGVGEVRGSEQTPRGWHVIRAKIGMNCPANTIFVGRRPTGEVYTPTLRVRYPERDWILTRIFWLSGLEVGKNRLGQVDTMRRYIYIHGTPDEVPMGVPGSKGCIRMGNEQIIELFEHIPVGTRILIR
ncbi:MAG: L,D-transpeptidase [Gammaproteobacteria bacterium]|nr:MAG: L,D-transpeptidase [Gammaproteobacteria bacterium]